MGFVLVSLADENRDLKVNFWNWRPTVRMIRLSGLISDDRAKELDIQTLGATVSSEEALALAHWFEKHPMSHMKPGDRMLLNFEITSEPDDGKFYREEKDQFRNYGASYEWLVQFVEFCKSSQGFYVL